MIKVLDVERRLPDGSIRVHLIADSTSDTLPTNCKQVTGLGVDYPIGIGSSCITASLDIALVGAKRNRPIMNMITKKSPNLLER